MANVSRERVCIDCSSARKTSTDVDDLMESKESFDLDQISTTSHARSFACEIRVSSLMFHTSIAFIGQACHFSSLSDSVLMTLSHETRMTTETELIFSPERTSNSSFQVFSSKKVRAALVRLLDRQFAPF